MRLTLFRNMWKDLPTRKAMRGRMYAKHWIRSSNNRPGRKIHFRYCFRNGWKPQKLTNKKLNFHISIIGAGPAGLACAETLIRRGVNCTVYDRYDEIGGLLTYGIPEFKLEKKVVLRRRKILEELGVKFVLSTEVNESNLKK